MIALTQMTSQQFDERRGEKLQQHLPQLQSHLGRATPNKFLDIHSNFVKNWGGWEVYIFYLFIFLTALNNRTVLKKHLIA